MSTSEQVYLLIEYSSDYDYDPEEEIVAAFIGPVGLSLPALKIRWVKETFVNSNLDSRGRPCVRVRRVPDKNRPFEKWLEEECGLKRVSCQKCNIEVMPEHMR